MQPRAKYPDVQQHCPRRARPEFLQLLGGYDPDRAPTFPQPTPEELRRAAFLLQLHAHGRCTRRARLA